MYVYLTFIIGFFILIKGADILVDGSVSIAKKMQISSIVIGLTVVAFGTSLPELVVNIIASAKGNTELAIGNILGSNIANILLILGVSAMIYPITANKNTVWKEIPYNLFAAILLGAFVNNFGIDNKFMGLSRVDGAIFLIFFAIFLYYVFKIRKSKLETPTEIKTEQYGYTKAIFFIILGLLCLFLGGKWIVDGAVKIATIFNIRESVIGLTIVAIGTSLPEFATSVAAVCKKQNDIAIGNVIGSNIFNIFWVLGISAIIRPLPFNTNSNFDVLMTIFSSFILLLVMFIGKKYTIKRWQGAIMLALYIGYIIYLLKL